MEFARWLVLTPLAVTLTAGSLAPRPLGGTAPDSTPWEPPPCAQEVTAPSGALTWYQLDPVLDRTGTLSGQRLAAGVAGQPSVVLQLAPESFASGPVDGVVLTGEDDGGRSRLRLLDPAGACAVTAGETADVVRSAVLAAGGRFLYEHRVDRATRVDLGVWRRDVGGPAVRVLEGLDPDPRFGPTFVTDLVLADDGRLVVSSCAPAGCRVRVLSPSDGTVTRIDGTGPALGVTGATAVVRAACGGYPCPVEAIDLDSGEVRRLAVDAYAAALAGAGQDRLVIETASGRVATFVVATGRRIQAAPVDGVPLRSGSTATAGAEAAGGRVVVAPTGRPRGAALVAFDPSPASSAARPEAER